MTAAEIVAKLGGRMRSRTSGVARCPAHEDRSPSLSIAEGSDGRLLVHCFAGCPQAEVIHRLRQLGAWLDRSGDAPEPTEAEREQQRQRDHEREALRLHREESAERLCLRLWAEAQPCAPQICRWLQARGIDPDPVGLDRMAHALHWHPRCSRGDATMPAMLALMTDPVTANPCGIHRTFLLPDGSGKALVDPVRMMLGHAGIVRLSRDEDVELGLGICEGIETGLAIMAAGWRPIWACGSLEMLKRFPVLGGIECLTVFADPKPQEITGARECAQRWADAGRQARLRIPRGGDWNAVTAQEVMEP